MTWKARASITHRLCTIAGFYRYAVEEELLDHSPAAHVRRPRLDYESHAVGLDRNELGALLVAAGLGPAVAIPLAPRTARAIDLAIGERAEGPIFLTADGRRLAMRSMVTTESGNLSARYVLAVIGARRGPGVRAKASPGVIC